MKNILTLSLLFILASGSMRCQALDWEVPGKGRKHPIELTYKIINNDTLKT